MADELHYARTTQAWLDRLALPVGVLLLLLAAWRVAEHQYFSAGAHASLAMLALSWTRPIRRKWQGRTLAAVGLGGMSLLVLLALAIDLGEARLPGVDVAARVGMAILFAVAAFGQTKRRSTDEMPTREDLLRDPGLPRRMAGLAAVSLGLAVEIVLIGADVADPVASPVLYAVAVLALLLSAFFLFGFIRSRQRLAG